MAGKRPRTYSKRDRPYVQPQTAPADADDIYTSNKRRKPTPPDSEPMTHPSLPSSHVLNGGGIPRSGKLKAVSKANGQKDYRSPTSLPTDDMDLEDDDDDDDDDFNPFTSSLAMGQGKSGPLQTKSKPFNLYGGGRNAFGSFSDKLKHQKRQQMMKKEKEAQAMVELSDDSSVGGGVRLPLNGAYQGGELRSDDMNVSVTDSDVTLVKGSLRGGSGLTTAEASARVFDGREYMAQPTAPPKKTLWSNKIRKDSDEALAWSANQENSPLLRLPANVRRRIFKFALGGNAIELDVLTYLLKEDSEGNEYYVPNFKYISNVYDDYDFNPLAESKPSRGDPEQVCGMTLLNDVCRQLYHETYTIPYSHNKFYIGSPNVLFNLIVMEDRFLPQQLAAITSIVTYYKIPGEAVLDKLPNLKQLRVMGADVPSEAGYYEVVKDGKKRKLVKTLAPVKAQPKPTIRGGGRATPGLGQYKVGWDWGVRTADDDIWDDYEHSKVQKKKTEKLSHDPRRGY